MTSMFQNPESTGTVGIDVDRVGADMAAAIASVEGLVLEVMRLRARVAELEAAAPRKTPEGIEHFGRMMRDWRIETGVLTEDDIPCYALTSFDVRVYDQGAEGVLVALGGLGSQQSLSLRLKIDDGQPSVAVHGGSFFEGQLLQTLFVVPGGDVLARPGERASPRVVPSGFLPGDASSVVRLALAGIGFAPTNEAAATDSVVFVDGERFRKETRLPGTAAQLSLEVQVGPDRVVLAAGVVGESPVARRERLVNSNEGVGTVLGDQLQELASVTVEVRDHVQRQNVSGRI